MRRSSRRALLLGGIAAGTVVAMASVAFACTQIIGKVTITGVSATGTATYEGNKEDGTDPSGGYCNTPTRVSFNTGNTNALTFELDVVRQTSAACNVNNLGGVIPAEVHAVKWIKDTSGTQAHSLDCTRKVEDNLTAANKWYKIGEMDLTGTTATQTTTKQFSLPPSGPVDSLLAHNVDFRGPGNICLDNDGSYELPTAFIEIV